MTRRPDSIAAPYLVALLGIAIFACMDALMKALSIALGAYNAMFWRSVIGLGLTGALFLLRGGRWPDRETLALHLGRGLAAALSVLLFFFGLARTPMAQGIALSFIAPLIALGLAALFLKERVGRRAVMASVIAFAGVLVILAGQGKTHAGPDARAGAAAILVAAMLYAVNLVVARRQSLRAGPLEVAFFFNLVALGLYLFGAPWLLIVPGAGYWPLLLGAAITSMISIMLLAWAYARAEAQRLVSVEYSAFIWASLLGWLVFGEHVSPATLAGAALIVAGCLWAARGDVPVSNVDPEASV